MSWVLIVAAVAATWLVFTLLIKLLKFTVKGALIIAALVFVLHFFGIGPGNLIEMGLNLFFPATSSNSPVNPSGNPSVNMPSNSPIITPSKMPK
jgi:hypothetical protein